MGIPRLSYIFNQKHFIEPLITLPFQNQGNYHSLASFTENLFEITYLL